MLGEVMKQKTYVMVKPDFANNQQVIDMVRTKILNAGFEISNEGFVSYTNKEAAAHYHEHVEKPFYPALEKYITSGKAYGMMVVGENAIDITYDSAFMGSTRNPNPGTIRYNGLKLMGYLDRDPMINGRENVAHSSDCVAAATLEIEIFDKDIREYFVSKYGETEVE